MSVPSCKSKKKITETNQKSHTEIAIENAKKDLNSIFSDDSMTTEEKEKKLNEIKAKGYNDPELSNMIAKAEQKIQAEKDEKERQKSEMAPKNRMIKYFTQISSASDADAANSKIKEAIQMCSSPETPVLIIISEDDGMVDYDKPTTISKYLNYLKDQKINNNEIKNLKIDDQGKIFEIELVKK